MCRARLQLVAKAALPWLLAGCPASGDDVRPPRDQFYFPTGMDIDRDQTVLFVASANSDLRYDSGAIQLVDVRRVEGIASEWNGGHGSQPEGRDCSVDLMVPYTLVCDEREVLRDAGVRIGNFATDLKVQTLVGEREGTLRLFLAVRGDPSLTWVDYDIEAGNLRCGSSGSFPECDSAHRLVQLRNDEDLISLPDEPFGLFVGSGPDSGIVVITHLNSGAVSLADAPPDGGEPILSDAIANLFTFNPNTGQRGAVGVAGRDPGSANDRIYVTSRVDPRVQTMVAVRQGRQLPTLVPTEYFFMNRSVINATDGRGIAFSTYRSEDPTRHRAGDRAYIVNRNPPMLMTFDTSIDELGQPRNEFVGGVELCAQASNLTVVAREDLSDGAEEAETGDRVFVACFNNGQIWSIDPDGGVVDAIIDIGRGPHAVVAAPARKLLFVSNNIEGTVAVVDLEPGSRTENRVVLRLGRPRSSGDLSE
jgi:hypothetical protein